MFLVGTYELVIDAKNRLSIPSAIRAKLDERRDGHSFYVLPGQRGGTLALFPEVYFERMRPIPPAEHLSPEAHAWRQFEFSQCALLVPDSQGRILIPERVLRRSKVSKDVVLIGVQDHLELWNRSEFEEFEKSQWEHYDENRARAMTELRAFAPAPELPTPVSAPATTA
jgi:MraZ protein